MKTIIERGASWTLEETKLLLALWGQDLVQRQATNQKRTKEVYEKISEKFNQSGFERTADQVRTRVFNMIAEYRRILKDPNPERVKKCIFFEALHKIYQAKHFDDVKSALDDYEPEYPYSPASNTISSEKGEESISDSEAQDGNESLTNNQSTATNDNNNHGGGNGGPGANSLANNNINTYSASATSDNNSDSINSNVNDNSGANSINISENSNSHPTSAKKIKLESPKSGTSQSSTPSEHANAHSKQNKSSSNQTGSLNNATPSLATNPALGAVNNSTNVKHQSLLLPHGTTSTSSTTSTPITKLTSGSNATPSYININQTKLPIIRTNQLLGNESINLNGTTTTRLPTTAAITSHQLYQAPVNTFDVTSSALLIDRMFAHLSRESENMREWIALEKERLSLERVRRAQETEREVRRERVLIDTLMRFQEQWISFLTRLGPGVLDNATEPPPELKLPPTDGASNEVVSQTTLTSGTQSVATTNTSATTSTSNLTNSSGTTTATTSSTTTSTNTLKQ